MKWTGIVVDYLTAGASVNGCFLRIHYGGACHSCWLSDSVALYGVDEIGWGAFSVLSRVDCVTTNYRAGTDGGVGIERSCRARSR